MKISLLRRYVVVAQDLHFPRAALALNIPLASLYTSIEKLEEEVGEQLIVRGANAHLTPTGVLFLEEAHRLIAQAPAPTQTQKAQGSGKAKASKGKGRTPRVKGQPVTYKKRQGR